MITAASLTLLVMLLVYMLFDPEQCKFFPKCIFHSISGLKCPGCGMQRAIHQLLNGNIKEALHYNALIIIAIPYLLLGMFVSFSCKNPTGDFIRKYLYQDKALYAVLIIIIIFWILRNIVPWL